jgi:hypothetical protein
MSDLSKAIVQSVDGNMVNIKILQVHPDGGVSTKGMSREAIEGTAVLFLYEIAATNKLSALLKLFNDIWGGRNGRPGSFPDPEKSAKFIKTLSIKEEERNKNWKKSYVLFEMELTAPALLKGLKVGQDGESAYDFFAYKWM